MSSNWVITIGRTFGSGGRVIGKALATELGMKYYDKEILAEAAKESGLNEACVDCLNIKWPSYRRLSFLNSTTGGFFI